MNDTDSTTASFRSEPSQKFSGTIRMVCRNDLDALRLILEKWLRDHHTGDVLADDVEETLTAIRESIIYRNKRRYLVAETSTGAVIGVMGINSKDIDPLLFSHPERPVELISAYVARSQHGGGAGRALADKLEILARFMDFTKLIVVSGSRNREGYGFWNRRYGNPVQIDSNFYGEDEERVVWTKVL